MFPATTTALTGPSVSHDAAGTELSAPTATPGQPNATTTNPSTPNRTLTSTAKRERPAAIQTPEPLTQHATR